MAMICDKPDQQIFQAKSFTLTENEVEMSSKCLATIMCMICQGNTYSRDLWVGCKPLLLLLQLLLMLQLLPLPPLRLLQHITVTVATPLLSSWLLLLLPQLLQSLQQSHRQIRYKKITDVKSNRKDTSSFVRLHPPAAAMLVSSSVKLSTPMMTDVTTSFCRSQRSATWDMLRPVTNHENNVRVQNEVCCTASGTSEDIKLRSHKPSQRPVICTFIRA